MKVIFIEDVASVARAGEIKEVAEGYARNYLIPRKLAMLATPRAVSEAKAALERKAAERVQTEEELRELSSQLEGKEFTVTAKTGGKDKLYGSITGADIVAEIKRAANLTVDRRKIDLESPIRQVGTYEVAVKLAADIIPIIKVTVKEAPKE